MCIHVQSITYMHPDKDVLFSNVSFTISKGQKVALIGNNGSGKSTLMRLILKSYYLLKDKLYVRISPILFHSILVSLII